MRIRTELKWEVRDFLKRDLLLIEHADGSVEIFNRPVAESAYDDARHGPLLTEDKTKNLVSWNTLALCNSDLSLFYERLLLGKMCGTGVMAAYNFNLHASLQNINIYLLNNGTKLYDLGAYIHIYPNGLDNMFSPFFGMMFKYTALSFNVVKQDASTGGVTKFIPATGGQPAFLFLGGMQWDVNSRFFLRGFGSLGFFSLQGEYRAEYNRLRNEDRKASDPKAKDENVGALLKLYFGINAGVKF
jgi:hypothetical protein